MNYKLIRSIAAVAIVGMFATACQKEGVTKSEEVLTLNGATRASSALLQDCEWNTDTINATGTSYAYAGTVPTSFTFPGGPTIQFEGNAASFIRPVTTDWFIGVDALENACEDWSTIRLGILRKNNAAHKGAAPASNPCNVVGYNTVLTSYGTGYYAYSQTPPNVPVVTRNVVLWYNANGTSDCYDAAPPAGAQAYVISVQSFTVTGAPPTLANQVIINWRAL
ncbi:hypothetical protein MKQ68_08335 [Chitinophaga horti]|uniref:HmuY protein n=1 Tax=Chitinophaga horti TaxID=2920382 RepID=A0ABY6J9T0_9BACT|nr:hypothetical protein [Chitinophaga horti]UYQ95102.1 hypothetical protein MKQ68_08335 [Chitinophaga horti]